MGKVLVAFFSASGVTKAVAEKIKNVTGGDIFEIVPEQIYTAADLDWMNKKSRSSLEMGDLSSRPAISSRVRDMSIYDTVFVGFPVWWYREPSIIDTFLESYDFSGKKIVPFCTSGGSGLGKATDNIQNLAPGSNVVAGERFSKGVSEAKLKEWAGSLM